MLSPQDQSSPFLGFGPALLPEGPLTLDESTCLGMTPHCAQSALLQAVSIVTGYISRVSQGLAKWPG